MLTVLTYDYVLSLGQEVAYVWDSKWGIVKILYLYSRYSPFIDTILAAEETQNFHISDASCRHTMIFNTVFAVLGIGISDLIFILRAYSMYHNSRKVLAILILFWTPVVVISVVTAMNWSGSYTAVTVPGFTGCILVSESKAELTAYILLMVGETVVVLLTLWKGFHNFYNYGFTSGTTRKVIVTFYRDGILYYLAILPITLATLLMLVCVPPELQILPTPFRVMHSIFCCKLIIHIREIARSEDEDEVSEFLEEIAFQSNREFSPQVA
ncbi:hypothetical protein GYMLUDRAFT_927926 [Collybiopsis luxurians FD-317 M1]|nr:hypothetical protein GYMLUDRAFT_927926 [Collybiopsis luxurians FD-317 M1]